MQRGSISTLTCRLTLPSRVDLPPVYLAPSLHLHPKGSLTQASHFSSTASNQARRGRDLSKNRGVSAIHRTGPKFPLGVSKYPLPTPVIPAERTARDPTPDHGLWGFFPRDKSPLSTPEYDHAHGRSWTIQELREKSWDDLHSLWWVCMKERNRIATSNAERDRLKAGYGLWEAENRDRTVIRTQKAIKHVLRERWYAWEDARKMYESGYRPQDEAGASALEEPTEEAVSKPEP